jgi:hypothetical protein
LIKDEDKEVYEDILKELKRLEASCDISIYTALQGIRFKSNKHEELISFIIKYFNRDRKKVGEHFRKALNKRGVITAKEVVYYTADATRATGDVVQKGFELAGQGINYLFHAVAGLIEKPVGGRPEHLKDVNLVKETFKRNK